ncbi:uncharacterized protein LOC142340793 isoform X2 [Convolutriloba macropyga]|uniref:uncharacterized protein LOC142340793 isoform X2 n=1 Tax=Convolutriloba macropyga TaxID=536237 RepID=UPI003F51C469
MASAPSSPVKMDLESVGLAPVEGIGDLLSDERFMLEFRACLAEFNEMQEASTFPRNFPSSITRDAAPPVVSSRHRGSIPMTDSDPSLEDIVYSAPDSINRGVVFSNEVSVFAYHNKDPVRPDLFQQRKESQVKFRQFVQHKVIQKQKQILNSWHNLVVRAKDDSTKHVPKSENEANSSSSTAIGSASDKSGNAISSTNLVPESSSPSKKSKHKDRWRKIVEQKILSRKSAPDYPVFAQHLDEELMDVRRSANSSPKVTTPVTEEIPINEETGFPGVKIEIERNSITIEVPVIDSNSHGLNGSICGNQDDEYRTSIQDGIDDEYGVNDVTTASNGQALSVRPKELPLNTKAQTGAETVPPKVDINGFSSLPPEDSNFATGAENAASNYKQPSPNTDNQDARIVYKVWAVYLLAIIHIASGILLLVFSSEGGIQMGADLPDVDEMMAANVTLQVPVNVWLGPSAHELSSDFFAFRIDCLAAATTLQKEELNMNSVDNSPVNMTQNRPDSSQLSCCFGPSTCDVFESTGQEVLGRQCRRPKIEYPSNSIQESDMCTEQGCFLHICGDSSTPYTLRLLMYIFSVLFYPLGLLDCLLCGGFVLCLGRAFERHWSALFILATHLSSLFLSQSISTFLVPNRLLIGWMPLCFTYFGIFISTRRKTSSCCFKSGTKQVAIILYFSLNLLLSAILPMCYAITVSVASLVGLVLGAVVVNKFDTNEERRLTFFIVLTVFSLALVAVSVIVLSFQVNNGTLLDRIETAEKYTLDCAMYSSKFYWCYV